MRVLFVPGYRYPAALTEPITSGDLRYTFNISRALARAGHTVTVLSRAAEDDPMDTMADGVRVVRYRSELGHVLSTSFDMSFRRARLFSQLVREVDIAFVNSPLSLELFIHFDTPFCYVASGLEDVKNYGRSGLEYAGRLAIRGVREPLKRLTWKRALFVNTTAEGEVDTLVHWGVPLSKVVSIGPSVERQRFKPLPDVGTHDLRQTLNLPTDGGLILSVSRFTPAKGLLGTLTAFCELRALREDVQLVMVGVEQSHSPGYLDAVRARIDELDLSDAVHLRLAVPERLLPLYYSAVDVTSVFSQMYDPLPTVIIESMACGTPVVSSNHRTRTQFIQDQVNGLFVQEGDTSAWVGAVMRLLTDEGLSHSISRNGLATVAEAFDADKVAEQLLSLFHRTAEWPS